MASRLHALSFLAILTVAGLLDAPDADRKLSIVELTAGQEDIVGWAVELFDDAELHLPAGITIIRFDSPERCFGRRAAHLVENGHSVIRICNKDTGPDAEHVVLHELAHAWDRHSLTDGRRSGFLRLRGLREWRNSDPDRWQDRGAEHAAEVMVWGLIDRPFSPSLKQHKTCADLLAGYAALTGRPPLHGFTDKC